MKKLIVFALIGIIALLTGCKPSLFKETENSCCRDSLDSLVNELAYTAVENYSAPTFTDAKSFMDYIQEEKIGKETRELVYSISDVELEQIAVYCVNKYGSVDIYTFALEYRATMEKALSNISPLSTSTSSSQNTSGFDSTQNIKKNGDNATAKLLQNSENLNHLEKK